jgi:hypothetical protein
MAGIETRDTMRGEKAYRLTLWVLTPLITSIVLCVENDRRRPTIMSISIVKPIDQLISVSS